MAEQPAHQSPDGTAVDDAQVAYQLERDYPDWMIWRSQPIDEARWYAVRLGQVSQQAGAAYGCAQTIHADDLTKLGAELDDQAARDERAIRRFGSVG